MPTETATAKILGHFVPLTEEEFDNLPQRVNNGGPEVYYNDNFPKEIREMEKYGFVDYFNYTCSLYPYYYQIDPELSLKPKDITIVWDADTGAYCYLVEVLYIDFEAYDETAHSTSLTSNISTIMSNHIVDNASKERLEKIYRLLAKDDRPMPEIQTKLFYHSYEEVY